MKKLVLPALIVAIGVGAAFAGNKAKVNETAYRFDESQGLCIETAQMCGEEETNPVCTWSEDSSVQLKRLNNPTECGKVLHEILP